jgi:hypothetical protein
MPPWPITFLALIPILYALDRLLLRLERKGWIYYRKIKPNNSGHTPTRGVLSTFQEILQPEIRYVKEDRDQRKAESTRQSPSDH